MRSSVLINEPPILVLPTLAAEIGLNEAMVLQQIHYWLSNERIKNHFHGKMWVRNTYDQWRQQFPFWGEKTLRRAFSSLEERQLVQSYISSEEFRKTKFYTIHYDNVENLELTPRPYIKKRTPSVSSVSRLASGQNDQIDLVKLSRPTEDSRIRGSPSGHFDQTNLVKLTRSYKEAETTFRDNILPPLTPPNSESAKVEDEEDLNQMRFKEIDLPNACLIKKGPTHQTVWTDRSGQIDQTESNSDSRETHDESGFEQLPSIRPSGHFDQIEAPERTDPDALLRDQRAICSRPKGSEEEDIPLRMIQVWNRLVQEKIKDTPRRELVLSESREKLLKSILVGILNHDLSEWERYCQQISETRFLLGENTSGFRVNLEWALNPNNALKILEGRIYDKPGVKETKTEISQGDFNQELEDWYQTQGYPTEWFAVYRHFANRHGQSTFRAWLKPCVPLSISTHQVELKAPTPFHRDYMVCHYQNEILQMLRTTNPSITDLTIRIEGKP